jgi:serine/threonine protein kinase
VRALREDKLGRYELLLELGRGGMAELFLARLRGYGGFERICALKRILPHLAQDPQFKDLFLNEGRIAAKLMHQNVCMVFELDEADGELFISMEYLDGVSWDQLIKHVHPGPQALRITASVIAQASEGLHYAHTLQDAAGQPTPVIHRDVSPHNVFIDLEGVCKVLDFGVSKMMTDGPRTRTGVIKGKLPYMAPEQIRGEPIDGRADVFSLGVCAWEALAGKRLFDRETDFQIWKAITEQEVPPIRTHWPDCPPAVDDAIRQALERDRDRRFTTTRGFAAALCSAAGGVMKNAQLVEAVRLHCGDQLEQRRAEVSTVLTGKREAADTIRDGDMRVRSEARRLTRDAASTVDLHPQHEPQRNDAVEPTRSHRGLWTMVLVAVLAAALAAVTVAFVMSRDPVPAATAEPDSGSEAGSDEDAWGAKAGDDLRKGLDDVRKAGEELRKLRDQFHGSN